MLLTLTIISLVLALLPALLFLVNLRLYAPPPCPPSGSPSQPVSVLIPARNEESSIGPAVQSALASTGVAFEVIVIDDHSEDRTAAIIEEIARADARVRLVSAPELPPGWSGKQHACWVLAREARAPLLVFLDADVRLAPDALARMAAFLASSGADLASGIPHQETGTLLETLEIPLIHFILLGFLPIRWMRKSRRLSFGAGCGQLFIARADAYHRCGGHAVIRETFHDGIKLPRAFRAAGFKTDLFDATDLATCRMYRGALEVWLGLAKNASEALAAPRLIVPMSLMLLGGQVLPLGCLIAGLRGWALPASPRTQVILALLATLAAFSPRIAGVVRFRQSRLGALLHPLGIVILVAIQWYALIRGVLGRPATWKGRPNPTPPGRSEARAHPELESSL